MCRLIRHEFPPDHLESSGLCFLMHESIVDFKCTVPFGGTIFWITPGLSNAAAPPESTRFLVSEKYHRCRMIDGLLSRVYSLTPSTILVPKLS